MKRISLGLLVLAMLVPPAAAQAAAPGGLTPVLSATGCLLRDPATAGFPACSPIGDWSQRQSSLNHWPDSARDRSTVRPGARNISRVLAPLVVTSALPIRRLHLD